MSMLGASFKQLLKQSATFNNGRRPLFGILRIAFNTVDRDRLQTVGPDRLCAEWILKNGGIVQFVNRTPTSDYNGLPSQDQKVHIQEVDATEASIMAIGFDHFKACTKIEKIILHKCKHMENEALEKLVHVKDTLRSLQISECYNVTDSGLKTLSQLINLNKLILRDLPYVQNMTLVEKELTASLPKCVIEINAKQM